MSLLPSKTCPCCNLLKPPKLYQTCSNSLHHVVPQIAGSYRGSYFSKVRSSVANFVAKSGKGAVQGAVAAAVRWRSLACIIHSLTNLAGRGLPLRNLRSEGRVPTWENWFQSLETGGSSNWESAVKKFQCIRSSISEPAIPKTGTVPSLGRVDSNLWELAVFRIGNAQFQDWDAWVPTFEKR